MAFNQNVEIVGLVSVDVAVPAAGVYFIEGKIQVPRIAAGALGVSQVVATITNQTGPVTLQTTTAGADGFKVSALCAADDVLRVALTSAGSYDASVKCQIEIGSGG